MEMLDTLQHRLATLINLLLDPMMAGIDTVNFTVSQQLERLGAPERWQSWIIAAIWVLVLAMLVRSLPAWLRLIALMLIGIVVARVYGVLPQA